MVARIICHVLINCNQDMQWLYYMSTTNHDPMGAGTSGGCCICAFLRGIAQGVIFIHMLHVYRPPSFLETTWKPKHRHMHDLSTAGTTASVCIIRKDRMFLANVGDLTQWYWGPDQRLTNPPTRPPWRH